MSRVARQGLAVAIGICAMVAIVAVVVAVDGQRPATTPRATVIDFIATGVIGVDNGYEPCSYLTLDEQHSVSAAAGGLGCTPALANAELLLGNDRVVTVGAL